MPARLDLRELAQAGEALAKARADEQAALDRIARAYLAADPVNRNLKLVEKMTYVPRTTLRRRIATVEASEENTPS